MGVCSRLLTWGGRWRSEHSNLNTLISLVTQCLDGIDYDDFNFGSHMMEQKEPLMETGKGPSGFALPGQWGFSEG